MHYSIRYVLVCLLQVDNEIAGIIVQEFQSLQEGWSVVREKVVDIAATDCSGSRVQNAVQAFQDETGEGNS